MWKVTLKGIWSKKVRFLLTGIAVMLGVAFVSGTFVLTETISGGVALNETMLQFAQDDLPFGGVGSSGMGHYHAFEGFEAFSKKKPIFHQARLNATSLLRPPFGKAVATFLKFVLGK